MRRRTRRLVSAVVLSLSLCPLLKSQAAPAGAPANPAPSAATLPARQGLEIRAVLKGDDASGESVDDPSQPGTPMRLAKDALITGADVEHADEQADGSVLVRLTEPAGERMKAYTRDHIGQRLAIVFHGKVLMAPNIQSTVGRDIMITFGQQGTDDERRRLLKVLNRSASTQPAQ